MDDELTHDGGEGYFGRLSGGAERVVFDFQVGVEADGHEGGHVKGLAQVGSAAADKALSAMLA